MRVSPRTALAVLVVLALGGCATTSPHPPAPVVAARVASDSAIEVIEDLQYGAGGAMPLLLDACLPADAAGGSRAAVVLIHGGSWARGDKADPEVRAACQWLADEGYVGFAINYRLAPGSTFPAQLNDVQKAVAWLRFDSQVERFGIDPARIGLLGASAGGNLAALAAAGGTGDWTAGSRVAAVVDLSGPSDLRAAIPTTSTYIYDFAQAELDYLGCAEFVGCATSGAASPITSLDPSDPPFFVAHSRDEFLPIVQSELLVQSLKAQSIPTTYLAVPGTAHALDLLNDAMKQAIADFFAATLD